MTTITPDTIVYGCPYIEVEYGWGSKPEGWKIFTDLATAKLLTAQDSQNGNHSWGYYGPERPIEIYEIPIFCIMELEDQTKLLKSGTCFINKFNPRFKNVIS